MKRALVALSFLVIPVWSCAAQSTPSQADSRNEGDSRLAVNLVRAVNTAEARHKQKMSKFAELGELETTKEWKEAINRFSREESKLTSVKLSQGANNAIQGWSLRLYVSPDRQAYLLTLQDDSSEGCGVSFQSDESGLIRQGVPLGCKHEGTIQK